MTKPKSAGSTIGAGTPVIAAPVIAVGREKKATKFVTVACKIPNGLVLQLCKSTKYWEETPSGSRERTRYDKTGPRVVAAGTSYPNGAVPPGYPPRPTMIGGYALTPGIPADFFEEWMKQNADSSFVVNKMIFGYASLDDTRGEAKDCQDVRSGFEPLNPDSDPRMPKGAPGVGPLKTADERVAAE